MEYFITFRKLHLHLVVFIHTMGWLSLAATVMSHINNNGTNSQNYNEQCGGGETEESNDGRKT